MTDTNDKLRGRFLAALMVLSVVGGTIAFAGAAAANHEDNPDIDADGHLESASTFWQGQELWISGPSGATWELRAVDTSGDSDTAGGLVQQVVLGDDGQAVIDTSDLDGFYVIENEANEFVDFSDGDGSATGTITEAQFEITVQSLSASFDEDDLPVSTGDTATIELDSARGNYLVNVSADGLDEDDLGEIFNQPGDDNSFVNGSDDDDDDDDSIQLDISSADAEIEANFTEFDQAGSYTFDIDVSDTTASANVSVDVQEEDLEQTFEQSVYSENVGDVVEITINMEDSTEAYLYVGGADVNYLSRVHVVDDDNDGQVTVELNTFEAGTGTFGGEAAGFEVTDDDVLEGTHRFSTADINDNTESDGELDQELTDFGGPIEAGNYGLTVTSVGDDPFANDDDELEIPDEQDVATLDLAERSTDGIQTWVAPSGDADEFDDDELGELLNLSTQSSTVAVGDRLIVQVQASGLYGYLDPADDGVSWENLTDESGDGTDESLYLLLESADAGANQPDSALTLDDGNAELYTAPENDTFYVVVDTRDSGLGIDAGETYEVTFQVGDEDDDQGNDNPYVDDDEEESVSTEFSAVDADASFDNVQGGTVQVVQAANATVSGSTNVAPTTELTIELRKTGENPFLETQTVTVGANGTWSATFDTSGIPGNTDATATVEADDELAESSAMIVEQVGTPTPTPTETTPTETTPTETTPTESTPTESTPTDEPPETTTTGGQPGFGVAIAVVALLAAALLAIRRRD